MCPQFRWPLLLLPLFFCKILAKSDPLQGNTAGGNCAVVLTVLTSSSCPLGSRWPFHAAGDRPASCGPLLLPLSERTGLTLPFRHAALPSHTSLPMPTFSDDLALCFTEKTGEMRSCTSSRRPVCCSRGRGLALAPQDGFAGARE